MKKILFIITLFIGLGNINAQFDATWKETVNFIEIYSQELYSYNNSSCESEYDEISISGEELVIRFKFKDGSGEVISKADLTKLKSITTVDDYFVIEFIGDYMKSSYNDGKTYQSNNNSSKVNIHFCNNDIKQRVHRAFKQLTKLAIEKRK